MVNERSYITIQAFMVNDLKLKGNELLIYAVIHGFSQDGESEFTGSLQYLADWCNTSKQTVLNTLQSLLEKQLIMKNVEFKNNLKFCTYKSCIVSKNFEQGSQNSLMGYSKNLNVGSQNSLPNNIIYNINNNLENTLPSCVQKQLENMNTDKYTEFFAQVFDTIKKHNLTGKRKIPVSKDFMQFKIKECRSLTPILMQESPASLMQALENYLKVANSQTWKNGFSFNAFCKNYVEYTSEYFDIKKYVDIPEGEKADEICEQFLRKKYAEKTDWFDVYLFNKYKKEWLKEGMPDGENLKQLIKKWGIIDDEGGNE